MQLKNPFTGHGITPADLYHLAYTQGLEAGGAMRPSPMILKDSVSGVVYHEAEGLCGFAGVVVKPARGAFVAYLKSEGIGYKHYYGGWYIPVHDHNQSYERKVAHAARMAVLLCDAGVTATVDSRLD